MPRPALFLLACLVVIAVVSASEEIKESSDLTESNFEVLERIARVAESKKRKSKNRKHKKRKLEKMGKKNKKAAKKNKKRKNKKRNNVKKAAKKKNNKKNKSRNNMKKGSKKRSGCRQFQADDICITNICDAWKVKNNQVKNFIRQTKRMVRHAEVTANKLAKQETFEADANTMTSVLGGNASAPACADDSSGSGAGTVAVGLGKCKANIAAGCPNIEISANLTGDGGCNTTVMAYKAMVEGCGSGDTETSCTCYKNATAMMATVKACAQQSKTQAADVKAKKTICKGKFSDCKKLQDQSVGFAAMCHKGGKYGKKTTYGMMATGVMRRNRILRQLMEQNMKRKARLNLT